MLSTSFDEPTIPPRLQRPLAAIWVSLGLHVLLVTLVQVAPSTTTRPGGPVIEARLVAPPAEQSLLGERPSVPGEMQAPSQVHSADPDAAPGDPPAAEPPQPEASPSASPVAEAAITTAVDLTYYSARELDVQPGALHEIVPDYPDEADARKLTGKVVLQLKVEADGRVSDVEVVSAHPPGVFEESAVAAFRDERFEPARKSGRLVRALMLIEVVFERNESPPQHGLGVAGQPDAD